MAVLLSVSRARPALSATICSPKSASAELARAELAPFFFFFPVARQLNIRHEGTSSRRVGGYAFGVYLLANFCFWRLTFVFGVLLRNVQLNGNDVIVNGGDEDSHCCGEPLCRLSPVQHCVW